MHFFIGCFALFYALGLVLMFRLLQGICKHENLQNLWATVLIVYVSFRHITAVYPYFLSVVVKAYFAPLANVVFTLVFTKKNRNFRKLVTS